MKTMKELCKRFNRLNKGECTATPDEINSYRGYYRVVLDNDWHYATYTFKSAREFREWLNGVILD